MLLKTTDYQITDDSFKLAQEWDENSTKHAKIALRRAIRMYNKKGMTKQLTVLLSAINFFDSYIINTTEGWWEYDPDGYSEWDEGCTVDRQYIWQ